jgi:aminoglycoside 6'-N-acetyltransferase
MPTTLRGASVLLRPRTPGDDAALARIRSTPEVRQRWGEPDGDEPALVIERDGVVVGAIQWDEETDPQYRHANMDIYLDPAVHGQGLGPDAVRTLAHHLFTVQGHHRITIDPAADNVAAIRAYEKVGFRPVGVLRRYERGLDGTWHDGLLMELLDDELVEG